MTKPIRNDEEQREARRTAGAAIGFGTSFAVGMALFALAGHWLDVKYGKEHLFTLLGIGLGLLYGGWELWKLAAGSNQPASQDEARQDTAGGKDNDAH